MSDKCGGSLEQYTESTRKLFPKGLAWRKRGGTYLSRLISGMAQEFYNVGQFVCDFLEEMDPNTTTKDGLLPTWNYDFGLPDGCSLAITEAECLAELLAKIRLEGGQSNQWFTDLATNVAGVSGINIQDFDYLTVNDRVGDRLSWIYKYLDPMRAGDRVMDRLNEIICEPAVHFWLVEIPTSATPDEVNLIKCLFNKYKPAHSQPVFIQV